MTRFASRTGGKLSSRQCHPQHGSATDRAADAEALFELGDLVDGIEIARFVHDVGQFGDRLEHRMEAEAVANMFAEA